MPLAADAKTRPLGPGTKGDAVGVLQTYLADQGYLPWTAVQGAYDYRTTQAVMAFQGWNGLTRTGTSADFVWSIPFCAIDDTQNPVQPSNCAGK